MKKFTVFAVLYALALGSCQFSLPTNVAPTAAVDLVGTTNALIQTGQAQTLVAQPSPTTVPPTFTFTPVLAEPSATPTLVAATTNTDTPVPNLTSTAFTATSVLTSTGVATTATATSALGQATASPTLGIRTYGTLPPLNRPYTQATLINRSKAEAYISLQIETDQGYTIIEYPVKKVVRVKIPTGDYTYVVWVGGRQFVGFFHASDLHEPVITIFKDKIVIK
jgi:hypothetical protein